jgi:hypothetical protein
MVRRQEWTRARRVREYPFSHAIAACMVLQSCHMLTLYGPSPFGGFIMLAAVLLSLMAGAMVLLGLQWKGSQFLALGFELSGHILAVGVWLLALIAQVLVGTTVFGVLFYLTLLGASLIRIVRLKKWQVDLRNTMGAV